MLLFITSVKGYAQTQSDTLQEIKVRGKHNPSSDAKLNEFSPGQKIKTIDSATLQQYQLQNMANLLAQQVPVFVKSYGFNGLATLNFRGSSAAQSAVLWNGVPIENAALGIADISALPVSLMSNVNIVYGGSAALWGSGNVGGALLLGNEPAVFDCNRRSLSVSAGIGSFGQSMGGLKLSISRRNWYLSADAFVQSGINNFPYANPAGIQQNMTNGHQDNFVAQVHAAYKISGDNVVGITAWYQDDYRQIPPALFETVSDKVQTDRSLRLLADWNKHTGKNTWYAKSSLTRDEVSYSDTLIQLKSDNVVYQYFQELGWKRQFYRYGQLLLFAPIQVSWMNQPVTNLLKQQSKTALAGAYDIKPFTEKLNVVVNGRYEIVNGEGIFLPGANASFGCADWLVLRANVQRTYRVPSLNELYYVPGGNQSLKPEQGWSEDAGYEVKAKTNNVNLYHDLSVFTRDIHDWIIWLGGAIWTPHNIAEVHSRGVETENNITWSVGKWEFHLGLNTSYVLATTVSSYVQNDGSIGKQIPYAPRYNGQANIGFRYHRFSLNYNQTYTGYRFTTSDESEYLLPYETGNVQVKYDMLVAGHSLQLTGQCNNIWNTQYQVVAFRPMPGTNWLAGFKFNIF